MDEDAGDHFPFSNNNNYDIVLGHSQGAILLSALLARNEVLRYIPDCKQTSNMKVPMAYILNGAAWPNPYDEQLLALPKINDSNNHRNNNKYDNHINDKHQSNEENGKDISSHPRLLFLMAENDPINPTSSARKVCKTYQSAGFDVSVVTHKGGHAVPMPKRCSQEGGDDILQGDAKNFHNGDDDARRALVAVADWIIDNVVVVKMQK